MRQVFSSPRLETVEGVAQLLREAGIEVSISEKRSYKGHTRGRFSYRAGAVNPPSPAVWVIHAEQLPQARSLLREAGLLGSTRPDVYVSPNMVETPAPAARKRSGWGLRIKLLVLAAIVGLLVLIARSMLGR